MASVHPPKLRITADSSEAQLLTALRAGDRDAYREAMRRYGGSMLAAARVVSPRNAEDAVQEAWISVYGAIASFEGRSSLKTWLTRIAMNKAHNTLRSQNREVSLDGMEENQNPLNGAFNASGQWGVQWQRWSDDTPQALLEAEVLQDCLAHHMDDLPEGQRMAITLKDIEGLSADEICNSLTISPSNFRVLLHRARIRLFAMVAHYEETGEC